MGWLTVHGSGQTSAKDFVLSQFDRPTHRVIDISVKGNVAYMACDCTIQHQGEDVRRVYGLVCLLRKDDGDWSYKPVDECMGPCEARCPKRIIDKLTPAEDDVSNDWRERCLNVARKRPALKEGMTIRFEHPLRFSDESGETTFTVEKLAHGRRRKMTAYRGENGRLYRIRGISKMDYTVVADEIDVDMMLPIVADNWETLRGVDVERLISEFDKKDWRKVAQVIAKKRPDLIGKAAEAISEVQNQIA